MRSDGLVRVGRVGRPHGLKGAFVVEEASSAPGRFDEGVTLYVNGQSARVIASYKAGARQVVRLDREVERGSELGVPPETLAEPEPDSFYVFQLVGLEVVEDGGAALGRVTGVAPGVANDVLELDSGLALPLVAACVRSVDLEARQIVVARGFGESG